MSPTISDFVDALSMLATKLVPGILGGIASIRFIPEGTTRIDRLASIIGAVAASNYAPDIIAGVFSVDISSMSGGIGFLAGVFSMLIFGELAKAIREVQFGAILSEGLRKLFRLNKE